MRPSTLLANSTQLRLTCVLMTMPPSGFHIYPRELLSLRNLLPRSLGTLSMVARILFCIRHLLSTQIAMLGTSISSRHLFRPVASPFSGRMLAASSSCFQNLFPAHSSCHRRVGRPEQMTIPVWGQACIPLRQPLLNGRHIRSPPWGFE